MSHYAPASRITRPIAPVSKRHRLNAKGRRFVRQATVLIVATTAAISFFSGQAATAGSTAVKANFTYVTIHSGESLWQLAAQLAPNQDRRDWIAKVVDLNALTSADVVPGQRIALP
jgi:Tfp pilus assembly protein FimV